MDYDGEIEPKGMALLFPSVIPESCHGCNWIHKRDCWFGGLRHDNPVDITEPDTKIIICNTRISKLDVLVNCGECKKNLVLDGKWGIVDDRIMCVECETYRDMWGKECNDCEYYLEPSGNEPCGSCWDKQAVPRNWKQRTVNMCEGCYFEKHADQTGYPCRICSDTGEGMSEWTKKQPIVDHDFGKCCNCGWHFETWDDPLETKNGDKYCYDCEKYGEYEMNSEGWDEGVDDYLIRNGERD